MSGWDEVGTDGAYSPRIGEIQHSPVDIGQYGPLFKSMPMADQGGKNHQDQAIDILIGNNYYSDLVTAERMQVTKGLYIIGSKLGWLVSGRINDPTFWDKKPSVVMMTSVAHMSTPQLPYME